MTIRKSLAAMLLVLALGACAELTAERPLFSLTDDAALPVLQEGIWISIGEGCAEHNLRRRHFPSDCVPMDIRREEDGAWRVRLRVDLLNDLSARERMETEGRDDNGPYRVILAPAVERSESLAYAPLYLGEIALMSAEGMSVSYAVIAPMGSMPASEMRMAATIGCDMILRDGPIEGVMPRYVTRTDEQGTTVEELDGCTASSQTAVREAARRAVIEGLNEFTARRWVRVRAD
jgi:hypothetical protein